MSSSIVDKLMIWSIFGVSSLEICLILFFTQDNLFKSTEFQFVHKDNYIVFLVTFTIIALVFKLIILASLNQSAGAVSTSTFDLSC
jgi:hypothetical protein